MIYILKHLKWIASFIATIVFFQSCVANTKKPATPYVIEQASREDIPIKITTTNGLEYELNWIEHPLGS